MRSVVGGLALALALFTPVLRAQIPGPHHPGLPRYETLPNYDDETIYVLYGTPSDTKCFVEEYQYDPGLLGLLTFVSPRKSGWAQYSCEQAANLAKEGTSPLGHARPAALDQPAAPSVSYLWVLSDTPPATAPSTDGAVYALDPNTLQTVATVLTPGPTPLAITGGNSGKYVYATIQGVPAGEMGIPAHPPLVEVINTSTFTITQTINLPQGVNPGRPALSPDDRYLYVPSDGTPSGLLVIDTLNPSSITTIPVTKTYRSGPSAFPVNRAVITPDGELLFLIAASVSPPDIFVIDITTGEQIADISGGTEVLYDLVIDPTGSRLYVAGQTHVYAYDTATLSQIGSVLTKQGAKLTSMGITSDGALVIANDQNGTASFLIDAVSLAATEADLAAPPAFPSGETPTSIMVVQ